MLRRLLAWFNGTPEIQHSKINEVALLNVARAVLEADPENFSMALYGREGKPCCALGHYAMRPDLQDFFGGLCQYNENAPHYFLSDSHGDPIGIFDDDVLEYFGITPNEAIELFGPVGCNHAQTPGKAAEYIYDFVRRRT